MISHLAWQTGRDRERDARMVYPNMLVSIFLADDVFSRGVISPGRDMLRGSQVPVE